jgi:ABC-type multidrug transport system ATPase subunit
VELRIDKLSKTYSNGVHALREVSLTIQPGMFGLLGPNGAGKSSLMRTIATLQRPDTGTVQLGDIDVLAKPEQVRRMLGYLPQEFGLYPKARAIDILDHFAVLKGVVSRGERKKVVEALLRQTNLWDARKKKLGTFSGGMRQRFGIAIALLGNPRLIIVDEPTAGLDPAERVRFLNLLSELGENAVVILSTHIVDDVADLCQHFAVINKGQILAVGAPGEAIAKLRGRIFKMVVDKGEVEGLRDSMAVVSTKLMGGRISVRVLADAAPEGFEAAEPDLEDVYFTTLSSMAVA